MNRLLPPALLLVSLLLTGCQGLTEEYINRPNRAFGPRWNDAQYEALLEHYTSDRSPLLVLSAFPTKAAFEGALNASGNSQPGPFESDATSRIKKVLAREKAARNLQADKARQATRDELDKQYAIAHNEAQRAKADARAIADEYKKAQVALVAAKQQTVAAHKAADADSKNDALQKKAKAADDYELTLQKNVDNLSSRLHLAASIAAVKNNTAAHAARAAINATSTNLLLTVSPDPYTPDGRDQIIADLMFMTDYAYDNYKYAMRHGDALIHFTNDVVILGLNAAGAVTGGAELKSILAVTSAAIVGTDIALSKEFLHEKTIEALVGQMDVNREAVRAKILLHQGHHADDKGTDIYDQSSIRLYSTRDAVVDLQSYNDAGNISTALVTLEKDMRQTADRSKFINDLKTRFDQDFSGTQPAPENPNGDTEPPTEPAPEPTTTPTSGPTTDPATRP